jgi:hypothetical protein
MVVYNPPNPLKISNVSVVTTITGRERILAVRLSTGTSVAKTIAIPVSLLEIYTSVN